MFYLLLLFFVGSVWFIEVKLNQNDSPDENECSQIHAHIISCSKSIIIIK